MRVCNPPARGLESGNEGEGKGTTVEIKGAVLPDLMVAGRRHLSPLLIETMQRQEVTMKSWLILALIAVLLLPSAGSVAQRKIGTTRSDQKSAPNPGTTSRGDRGSAPAKSPPAPAHYSPTPTPVQAPVNPPPPPMHRHGGILLNDAVMYRDPVPQTVYCEASVEEVEPMEPAPDNVELYDRNRVPGLSGYDFSEAHVVPCNDQSSDMCFVNLGGKYSMTVDNDTDIQDLGEVGVRGESSEIPPSGWSKGHSVALLAGHIYIVWEWNGDCARFEVQEITPVSVTFAWTPMGTIARTGHGPMFER